jgi:hypothetical protein
MTYTKKTRRREEGKEEKRSKSRHDLCAWNHRTVYHKPRLKIENA